VETTINTQVQNLADTWGVTRDSVFKVFVANLTSEGPSHAAHSLDLARFIGDQVSQDPERSVGIVILPNTGGHGAGTGTSAITQAQRSIMNILEDSACQLETREAVLFFEESSMYSKSRSAYHPIAIAFSNMRWPDAPHGFRSKFESSAIYVRRVIPGVPVRQRHEFCLPANKGSFNVGALSSAAELKQHITGVGMWTQAPLDALAATLFLECVMW
jgi:hypothetical protein